MNHHCCVAGNTRRSILHVGAHAAQGLDGQIIRLRPTLFRLLQLLVELPPDHVARYDDVAQALWPDGMYPNNIPDGVQWHARQLNGVLVMVGYAPKAVRVVDRVGLVFEPRSLETPGNCTASLHR